jgi:predicted alpha/beta hydrolase family esterase
MLWMKILSRLAPGFVSKKLIHQLHHPSVKKLRPHEIARLQESKQSLVHFKSHKVKCYSWKSTSNPALGEVILVHGWEGQAGNFADFIPLLLDAGFDVFAFDAPGHGFTLSEDTSVFEFLEVVKSFLQKRKPKFIVSHSFGGVAVSNALSDLDLKVKKYLLFTTPNSFGERIRDLSAQMGVSKKVVERVKRYFVEEEGFDLNGLSVAEFVQKADVEEALIIHDENDGVIGIDQSETVVNVWPAARLLRMQGTGHFRILRDDRSLQFGKSFLTE